MRHAAVLGHPIAHSLSPVIHLTAYEMLGLAWTYERVDITPDRLPDWITSRTADWAGVSLTMPLKTDVLALLDGMDDVVRATGAANTVVFGPTGRQGFNTDVHGIVEAVRQVGVGTAPSVLVIGGGATARSAVAAAAQLNCRSVDILARRPEACDDLLTTASELGIDVQVTPWTAADVDLTHDVVISTVPAGVADSLIHSVPASPGVLLDVVYQGWPTPFARAWHDHQGPAASGLEMLLHQGLEQVALMTGQRVTADQIRPSLVAAAAAL